VLAESVKNREGVVALVGRIAYLAGHNAEGIAVINHGRSICYDALYADIRRMSGWLLKQGMRPGDCAGLTVSDEYAHLVTSLAFMRLGCSHITLPSREPATMRSALASRCNASCVICDGPQARLPDMASLEPSFEDIFGDSDLETDPSDQETQALLLMTSSGTTGRPKLIHCTQSQIFGYGLPDIPSPAVLYRLTSIESNVGKWSHLSNLAHGRTLVFCDMEKYHLTEICARHGVTMANMSGARAAALLRDIGDSRGVPAFEGVRFVLGGSPVPGPLREQIQRHLTAELYVMYGATECGIVTAAGPETHSSLPGGVGRPLPGVEIRVVDDDGRPLPAGELGSVCIRSRVSATSYFDDPEASARSFRDGWFLPGDMASLTPDGMLDFAGRGDDMMILNTINIFPSEIETVAEAYPGVNSCAAFSVPSKAYGDIPILAVVADAGFDLSALREHCREHLGLRAPRKVVRVENIPRNSVGKVMRRELQARFGGTV
jgi:acyl-coenzyme A synthetase/AMP-(fatty) acid ligase